MYRSPRTLSASALMVWCLFFFTSCQKRESSPPADLKASYFPLKLNSSLIYEVDSTVYNDFTGTQTQYLFEIKDTVISTIESEEGGTTVYIERYKKSNSGEWKFQKVISRSLKELRAEEFIDNRRYVRLTFPPEKYKSWNGNTYNNQDQQEYYFKAVDIPLSINNLNFDSTAVVVQMEEENLIREDYSEEVYAKHAGLVKKTVTALDKDISSGRIIRGFVYTMKIKSVN